ncbi:B12-binding domain-containing radical SAM protein [Pseudodesulfovibrio sp.]|nr:B12-binding domain-containing radical SAM protein [Pseudodesulfovibrio sp.]
MAMMPYFELTQETFLHFILIRPSTEVSGVTYSSSRFLSMPFGCLYLIYHLEQNGITTAFFDDVDQDSIDEIFDAITDDTVAVGISSMSGTQFKKAILIADNIRQRTDLPLVWGGVHVTHLPEQSCMDHLVDYCLVGEGEERLPILLKAIESGDVEGAASVPGVFTESGPNIPLEKGQLYTNLKQKIDLPYDILDMERYVRPLLVGPKRETLCWTSRGCPYSCRFCSNPSNAWPNTRVRLHSIDHVVDEIKLLTNKYGVDGIHFTDENFVLSENRLLKLFKRLEAENISCSYRFSGRVDGLLKLKESTYAYLKEVGVISIASAPESGSQHVLDIMGKGIRSEQIFELDEMLTRHRFNKTYNILFGVPGETLEDVNQTIDMIVKIAKNSTYCPYPFAYPALYIPLPGTELYTDAVRAGFQPPSTFQGWGYFDLEKAQDTLEQIRPWISGEYKAHLFKAMKEIVALIETMTGKDLDPVAFEKQVAALSQMSSHS